MTREELYQSYLAWHRGAEPIGMDVLFQNTAANKDVFEDDKTVINHLYYLLLERDGESTRYFLFYEVNTFEKTAAGELVLAHSVCCIPESG